MAFNLMEPLLWSFLIGVATTLNARSLTLERTIELPGVHGRIDHFGLDLKGARLFVAALGNDTVEVVDLNQGRVVYSIAGLAEPQGILYLPKTNRVYVTNGGDGTLRLFNGTS